MTFEIQEDVIAMLIKRFGELGIEVTNRDIESYFKDCFILREAAGEHGFRITVTDKEV